MADLDPLFFPKSIAVIGASNRPLTIGHRIVSNLLDNGFTGKVTPVNPKATPILDLTSAPSILEVEGDVDLAHVIVKRSLVPMVLRDCAKKGVKVCIVNTSGFKEMGPEGVAAEQEIVAIAKEHGIRLFGPNCQGVMNTDPSVSLYSNFTFAEMTAGHISMVCQGGGVAEVINNYFGMNRVGQRMYASNGNACDISIPEILEYYGDDDDCHAIVLHVESFADPAEFLERVRPVAAKKPILALKSGTTPEGARAVSSHTGGLMAADTVTDVIFDKCGILRFRSLGELCEAAQAFATQPIPRGNRIGMVTNAGSPAIIITDEAIGAGLRVPDLAEASKDALREKLQSIASIANPIDMAATASGPEFAASLQALVDDPNLDAAVICFMTPFFVDTLSIADAIVEQAQRTDKTLIAVAMTNPGGKPEWSETVKRVRDAGVPVYYFPATAAKVLYHMDRFRKLRERPAASTSASDTAQTLQVDVDAARSILGSAKPGPDGFMDPAEVSALLAAYDIPFAPEARGTTWAEVQSAATHVGYPVVLKAEAPTLIHKTESGAVVLNITDAASLEAAHSDLRDRLGDSHDLTFLVQKYQAQGLEVIVGGVAAQGLGSMVMFGLGGVHVEIFKDVAFKLAPLSTPEAEELLDAITSAPLLAGYRGQPAVDRPALVDVLLRVSRLLADHPEIEELDCNPVVVFPAGTPPAVVDARIKLAPR
jgi:acetate---CoA ligase (ADP-forming)